MLFKFSFFWKVLQWLSDWIHSIIWYFTKMLPLLWPPSGWRWLFSISKLEVLLLWALWHTVRLPSPRPRVAVAEDQAKWLGKKLSSIWAIFSWTHRNPLDLYVGIAFTLHSPCESTFGKSLSLLNQGGCRFEGCGECHSKRLHWACAFLVAERDSPSLILCEIR